MPSGILEQPETNPISRPSRREPARSQPKRVVPEGDRPVDVLEVFAPHRLRWRNMDWVVLGWMIVMHVGTLVAPFFFSWTALGVAIGLHWLTASIGICLGYHRYLAHRTFKLKSPAEFFVLLCGILSGEGTPLKWAATHRLHHQRSDLKGDPHSPNDGRWWSHLLWIFIRHTPRQEEALFKKYTPELLERPVIRFLDRSTPYWLFGSAIAVTAIGYAIGGWPEALTFFLWGVCVRLVVAYHSTWFVNSATHIWGYRNYETRDLSRNLWWVALLSYGEGWHNNHHAHPSVAQAGHRWWEIDMTMWSIRALQFVGLATDVKDELPAKGAPAADG